MGYQLAHAIRMVLRRAHIGVINMDKWYSRQEYARIMRRKYGAIKRRKDMDNAYAELKQAVADGDTDKARHLLESTDWRTGQEHGWNVFPEEPGVSYDTAGFMISRLHKQIEIGRAVGFYAASPS
jgi:hypothetical protein